MGGRSWLITGCATGFGRALAEAALARGDRVAASDRNREAIADLAERYPDTALALQLDVTRHEQVEAALAEAFGHGRIDVLVNNAGFGMRCALEEAEEAEIRRMFEVNFFGMTDVIRTALPRLRAQGAGHIINFASVGGRVSAPLLTLYSASKFAIEGLSEGLAQELAHLGIKVTMVEPGAFATQFGASAAMAGRELEAYRPVREQMDALIGDLPMGKASDLANAILALADSPEPPLRFVGGADAYAMIAANLKAQQDEMAAWRSLSESANTAVL